MTATTAAQSESHQVSGLPLWAGVLGAPAAWALQMQINYILVPWICHHGYTVVWFVCTLVFFLVAATGGLVSLHRWLHAGGQSTEQDAGGPVARTEFLGLLGFLVSCLFSLLILAQGSAAFFLSPCWD